MQCHQRIPRTPRRAAGSSTPRCRRQHASGAPSCLHRALRQQGEQLQRQEQQQPQQQRPHRVHGGGSRGARAQLMPILSASDDVQLKPQPPASAEDATLECLMLLRRADVDELAPFIPTPMLLPPHTAVVVGEQLVVEEGPLARCALVMDAAARRVLPGHLLRRCRVLSSLQLGGSCVQRVALTSCSGEEVVLNWRLERRQLATAGLADSKVVEGPCSVSGSGGSGGSSSSGEGGVSGSSDSCSSSRSSGGEGGVCSGGLGDATSSSGQPLEQGMGSAALSRNSGSGGALGDGLATASGSSSGSSADRGIADSGGTSAGGDGGGADSGWQLASISRDASNDAQLLPTRPHPRAPPELVVQAQLVAFAAGQLHAAARFMLWGRHASASGWQLQMDGLRALLRQPPYHLLLTHGDGGGGNGSAGVQLGAGALPTQRTFVQEVELTARGGRSAAFLWHMCMQGDGCWMVRAIEAV